MRHNEKKNDPHYEDFVQHLSKLTGGPVSRKEAVDDEAREIARGWKESRLGEDLRRFRQKEDRQDAAKKLREAHRVLQHIAPLLRDDPQNPTIQVMRFKNRRLQEDSWLTIKLLDYLATGHVNRVADCIEAYGSPKGAAPKYIIKMAAEDLEKFYRDNWDGPTSEIWETVARIILEIFPDAQKRNGANYSEGHRAGWIRQLISRK